MPYSRKGPVGDALMPRRMVPVIRQLRRKPLMEGQDERRGRGRVANLGAIWEGSVLHIHVLSAGLQRGQPWHIRPMNFGWIGEIALAKLLGLLLEMRLDQGNLRTIRWIFGRDRLPAAIRKGLEHVQGLFEVEGHDLGPSRGHLLLAGRWRAYTGAVQETDQGKNDEHHSTGNPWPAPRSRP